ncbi:hypothetical protein AMTR_s00036p00203640, partial [Amborella trichopoda]
MLVPLLPMAMPSPIIPELTLPPIPLFIVAFPFGVWLLFRDCCDAPPLLLFLQELMSHLLLEMVVSLGVLRMGFRKSTELNYHLVEVDCGLSSWSLSKHVQVVTKNYSSIQAVDGGGTSTNM